MNKNEIELKNQFKLLIAALLLFSSTINAQCLSGDCTNGIGIWKDALVLFTKENLRMALLRVKVY